MGERRASILSWGFGMGYIRRKRGSGKQGITVGWSRKTVTEEEAVVYLFIFEAPSEDDPIPIERKSPVPVARGRANKTLDHMPPSYVQLKLEKDDTKEIPTTNEKKRTGQHDKSIINSFRKAVHLLSRSRDIV